MSASVSTLDKGWYWKQRNTAIEVVTDELPSATSSPAVTGGSNITTSWNPTASFPSEVHVELLKCGKIPHPYVAFNEHKVQWIGEVEWLYYCTFGRVQKLANQRSELVLEGLDTICDVYLNGTKVLSTSNMFHAHAIPLDDSVTSSKLNTIFLHFKSAKKAAKDEEDRYGAVRAGSTNLGDPSRVYIRKAQYDWRWDWGPELMTCGPFRPVRIETYKARISELQPCVNVHFTNTSGSKYAVNLSVNVVMEGAFDGKCSLSVSLKDLKGNVVMQTANTPLHASRDSNTVSIKPFVQWSLSETLVQLWWPVGYGNQTLYNLEAHLSSGVGEVLHRVTKRIGFRAVELVQDPLREPDQYGTGSTFLFEINKVRMFMGGSNWIPADNFLTTITEERYRAWLKLLVKGNQNMVRVWGGGIYEPDVFYDICDELGVLVWQDFQFACGVYPAHDDFVESVRKEATEAVLRLRHHPSLVLLCGNNEDYQQVLQWGGIDALPARKIYEEILPNVVANLTDPPIPYHRGSPYGGKGWDTSDPTIGDVHQWNIWGGKELPYQEYENMGGRFVSEFGVPSMPSMGTIKTWMIGADESDWYPQSIWMAQHTKAGSFERRFAILMNENYRLTGDLEIYRYTTQLLQSEAMKYAYSVWRRKWCGKGKEYTAGVLIWQLNDCWPVTSWAIVDYYFYEFGATQSHTARIEIWGTNSTLRPINADLELVCVALDSDWSYKEVRHVVLRPNQATEILSMPLPGPSGASNAAVSAGAEDYNVPEWTTTKTVVVSARLTGPSSGNSNTVLARSVDWPQPLKHVCIPDPQIQVTRHKDELTISVKKPVKGLFFTVGDDSPDMGFGDGVEWSDNTLDVMPGDDRAIVAHGVGDRDIYMAYFGQEIPRLVKLQGLN